MTNILILIEKAHQHMKQVTWVWKCLREIKVKSKNKTLIKVTPNFFLKFINGLLKLDEWT